MLLSFSPLSPPIHMMLSQKRAHLTIDNSIHIKRITVITIIVGEWVNSNIRDPSS